MAYRILSNKENSTVVIHATESSGSITIAGNNSVSNVATGSEVVEGAAIRSASWGTSNGAHWTVARGANTVLILGGEGNVNYAAQGTPIMLDTGATLVATLANGAAGDAFIVLELSKIVDPTSETL